MLRLVKIGFVVLCMALGGHCHASLLGCLKSVLWGQTHPLQDYLRAKLSLSADTARGLADALEARLRSTVDEAKRSGVSEAAVEAMRAGPYTAGSLAPQAVFWGI